MILVGGKAHVELVLLAELLVLLHAVRRDADHRDTGLSELTGKSREVLGLCRAAGGVVLRVEVDDGGASREICWADGVAVVRRQFERWYFVTFFDRGCVHRGNALVRSLF